MTALLLGNLGAYYLALGDTESAATFSREAVRMSLEVDDEWQALQAVDVYARVAQERRDVDVAALLLGYVEARLAVLRVPRQPHDRQRMAAVERSLRTVLGPELAERRLRDGGALSSEQMLELIDRELTASPIAPRLAS